MLTNIIIFILSVLVIVLSYYCNAIHHMDIHWEIRLRISVWLAWIWFVLLIVDVWLLTGELLQRTFFNIILCVMVGIAIQLMFYAWSKWRFSKK